MEHDKRIIFTPTASGISPEMQIYTEAACRTRDSCISGGGQFCFPDQGSSHADTDLYMNLQIFLKATLLRITQKDRRNRFATSIVATPDGAHNKGPTGSFSRLTENCKDSRTHRGRDSRLAHRARELGTVFRAV